MRAPLKALKDSEGSSFGGLVWERVPELGEGGGGGGQSNRRLMVDRRAVERRRRSGWIVETGRCNDDTVFCRRDNACSFFKDLY